MNKIKLQSGLVSAEPIFKDAEKFMQYISAAVMKGSFMARVNPALFVMDAKVAFCGKMLGYFDCIDSSAYYLSKTDLFELHYHGCISDADYEAAKASF